MTCNLDRQMKFLELARRVEALERPDREIDYAIHEAIHGGWLQRHSYIREPGDNGWYSATPPVKGANSLAGPQSYTASLDGAIQLVPAGWSTSIGQLMGVPTERRWRAHLRDCRPESATPAGHSQYWEEGNTSAAALALAASALRAHADVLRRQTATNESCVEVRTSTRDSAEFLDTNER